MELAQLEADRLEHLAEKDAAAPFEVQRAAIEAELQQITLEQANQNYGEARIQLQQAQARHEQYVLRAPRAGTIERIGVEAGETVEQLQPVMRLVHIERLRVDASVPLGETLGLKVGDPAWVTFQVAEHQYDLVKGKIVHLAAVQDAASNPRRTRVEIANPAELPAGCRVLVHFRPPQQSAAKQREREESVRQ